MPRDSRRVHCTHAQVDCSFQQRVPVRPTIGKSRKLLLDLQCSLRRLLVSLSRCRPGVNRRHRYGQDCTDGHTDNATVITFVTATASWGTITHVGIFDKVTGGNLLFHGALTASKAVGNGDTFKFNANELDLTFA